MKQSTYIITALIIILAGVLIWVFQPVDPSEKAEELIKKEAELNIREEKMIEVNSVLNDSISAMREREALQTLEWNHEEQEKEKRNKVLIPAEAERINSSDTDSQLEYIKSLRDSAKERGTY